MAENVQDITLDILKAIRADIARVEEKIDARFVRNDERLERIEELTRKVRRDYAGMLVMMRAVTGDFDQRVADIEERVAALEAGEQAGR